MVLQFGKVSQKLLARVGQGSEYYCPVCCTSQATRLKTFSYLLQLKEETFVESCSTHHFCCCAISDRCTVARWALCYKFIPKQLCLQFLVLQKRFKLDGFFVVVFFFPRLYRMLLELVHQLRLSSNGSLVTYQILRSGELLFLIHITRQTRPQSMNYSTSFLAIQHFLQGTYLSFT